MAVAQLEVLFQLHLKGWRKTTKFFIIGLLVSGTRLKQEH